MATQVVLIPGFMGFQTIGDLSYFRRVSSMLTGYLNERGIVDVTVHEAPTAPTGSIARRAQVVLKWLIANGGAEAHNIHLIGHSTGGLDARLLVAPGVRLLEGDYEEMIARRVRSVISVSTPHYGTPMANLLLKLPLRSTIERLAFMGSSKPGRGLLLLVAQVLDALSSLDDFLGRTDTFLDAVVDKLLSQLSVKTNDPTWDLLREMSNDTGAAIQLTVESMHLFNAAVADRQDVRYSSLITAAPEPTRFRLSEFWSPINAIKKLAFRVLYLMSSRVSKSYPYTATEPSDLNIEDMASPIEITKQSNDGIVPCQSQAYGRVLDIVLGDHLDIVGQFPDAGGDPHADWLPCGAHFGEAHFRAAWAKIADEILAAEQRNVRSLKRRSRSRKKAA
ncbi:MAG: hypothetical protein KC636_33310 [Myxococcales bacterium]|nr:hypothetical protein [Myxococcales bacterium]